MSQDPEKQTTQTNQVPQTSSTHKVRFINKLSEANSTDY